VIRALSVTVVSAGAPPEEPEDEDADEADEARPEEE
jgi:hypothetical protein